jgi:hypothetical protein
LQYLRRWCTDKRDLGAHCSFEAKVFVHPDYRVILGQGCKFTLLYLPPPFYRSGDL